MEKQETPISCNQWALAASSSTTPRPARINPALRRTFCSPYLLFLFRFLFVSLLCFPTPFCSLPLPPSLVFASISLHLSVPLLFSYQSIRFVLVSRQPVLASKYCRKSTLRDECLSRFVAPITSQTIVVSSPRFSCFPSALPSLSRNIIVRVPFRRVITAKLRHIAAYHNGAEMSSRLSALTVR